MNDQPRKAIVTTKHRGVFYGELLELERSGPQDYRAEMRNVIMVINFGTTQGLLQLAQTGPTSESRLSSVCPSATLLDVTAVFDVTDKAAFKFNNE